ncbi:MAG: ankyrin repeat domain-containing protein, partial [Planctomycetota bacterium]
MKIKSGLPAIIIFLLCLSFMLWGFTSKSEEQKQEAKPLAAHTEIDQGTASQNTTNPTTDITNEDKSTNDGANLPLTAEAFGLKVDDLAVNTDSITLELAIKEDSLERTKAILKNGANPNLKNPITKRTPLEVAAMHTSSDEITRLLFAHGAKIDKEDNSDYSLLSRAITTAAPASL